MSNIICNNIVSSGFITVTGDFVLGTSNLNTMTVNSRSVFNGILNCGTLNTGQITQTGAVGFTSGSGKINLQGDVEILGNKSFTTGTGTININGILNLSNVTPSTGWTTGAVTIQGGLGVFGNINGGENMSCIKNLSVYGDTISLKNGENYLYVNDENDISITGGRNMYIQTGGEARLFINLNGSVGIGMLIPTEKMEINGDIFVNNTTNLTNSSKLYLGSKNNYLYGDNLDMTLKTNGEIHLEAGIDSSIYLNNDVICEKSIYLNGPSSIIASSGKIQSKYFKAFNSSSLHTETLGGSSYLGYSSLGLEETNLINVSSELGLGGFYFHNKTTASTNSKLLMCINGAGNVGIGTETPTTKLDIVGDVNIKTLSNTSSMCVNYEGKVGIGIETPTEKLEVLGDVFINNPISKLYLGVKNNYILGDATNMAIRTNGDLFIQDTNATLQKLIIKNDGKIGIGTSTPSSMFNVNGDTVLDGGLKINSESTPISTVFYNNGAGSGVGNQFRLVRVNGTKTTPLNVNSGDLIGTVQAQGYDTTTGNHVRSSSIAFYANQNYTSSTTNGGYLTFETTADNVGFTPTERLRVTSSGNVGIGTTTPFFKLDVSGTIQANNFVRKNVGWNTDYVYNFTQNEIFTDFQGLDTNIFLRNFSAGCYLISFNIILHRNTADVHLKGFNIRIGTEPNFTDVYEYLDTSDETLTMGKFKTITFFDTYYTTSGKDLYLSYRNSIAETEILQVYKGFLKITRVY